MFISTGLAGPPRKDSGLPAWQQQQGGSPHWWTCRLTAPTHHHPGQPQDESGGCSGTVLGQCQVLGGVIPGQETQETLPPERDGGQCWVNVNVTTSRATQYKCCPPISDENNQELLWEAVMAGDIDMIVSDHSPCKPDLKLPGKSNIYQLGSLSHS